MSFGLSEKVLTLLKQKPGRKLSATEIANWIVQNYPEDCRKKQLNSTADEIRNGNREAVGKQIRSEITSRKLALVKKYESLHFTDEKPMRFYYGESGGDQNIIRVELPQKPPVARKSRNDDTAKEHVLYPVLTKYLKNGLEIYSKRIDEKHSRNSHGAKGNKWLYPDVVGMENLSQSWDYEIKECVKAHSDKKAKFWSFEVKLKITRGNVRESFFQAVSNSSWANFGYLAAGELDDKATKELQILSGLHGIGFIQLDRRNFSNSKIIIPAKERVEIDWNIANRLATENKDFKEYILSVRSFYQTGRVRPGDWDS